MHLQLETEFNVEPAPTFLQHSLCWWICVWKFWIRVLTLVSWTEFGLHAYCAVFWSICSVGFLMVFNESFMKCPGLPLVTQSTTQSCTLSAYSLWLSLVCNLSLGPHKINLILLPFTSLKPEDVLNKITPETEPFTITSYLSVTFKCFYSSPYLRTSDPSHSFRT